MKKVVFAVIAAMMVISMIAGPAAANVIPNVAGVVISAAATVSKGVNPDTGCANGQGGGIGLPLITESKKAYYSFNAAPAILKTSNVGDITTLVVCGQIDPVAGQPGDRPGLGAACGLSAGNNGDGTATAGLTTVGLKDLGWDVSAASGFIVTGSVISGAKRGGLLAIVSAKNTGTQCTEKELEGPKSRGAGNFLVDIVFVLGEDVPDVKHTKP